jgi:hypothetical protein
MPDKSGPDKRNIEKMPSFSLKELQKKEKEHQQNEKARNIRL